MTARVAALVAFGGVLVAVLGAVGVALGDKPHLSFDRLDPWLIVYAIGLLVALGALPFPLHARYEARTEDRDKRWELALTAWGGIAIAADDRIRPPRAVRRVRGGVGLRCPGDRRRLCLRSRDRRPGGPDRHDGLSAGHSAP